MKKFSRLFLATVVSFGFLAAAQADDLASIFAPATKTNAPMAIPRRASIIFIQCHGLGYGDLSCYGQTNFQTPNLDRLAAEGIRFNHYAGGIGTNFQGQAWLMSGTESSGSTNETVAQILKKSGYVTSFVGEWLLDSAPWTQGFEEFHGFLHPDEGLNYYSDYFWLHSPGTVYDQSPGHEPIYANTGGKKDISTTDFFFKLALNTIKIDHPDKFHKYRPFFLMLSLPAPRTATPGRDNFPVASDAPYSDESWPQAAKNRAALLTRLDGKIGELFQQLDQLGMTNNVVIFFSSSAPPEKFADKKLDFFHSAADMRTNDADVFNAPMIVRWPGYIPAGQVSDANWSAADFLPTAAEIGFAKVPGKIDGVSMLPTLLGEKPKTLPGESHVGDSTTIQ